MPGLEGDELGAAASGEGRVHPAVVSGAAWMALGWALSFMRSEGQSPSSASAEGR